MSGASGGAVLLVEDDDGGDAYTNRIVTLAGLFLAAVTVLIFDVTAGALAGVVAGVVVLVFYALVWVALPMSLLRQEGSY